MRVTAVRSVVIAALAAGGLAVPRASAQDRPHDAAAHAHAEAAKLVNPVEATPQSIAAGGRLFRDQCARCHGAAGLGDGRDGAALNPKPANLTDETWTHGSSDGEIFVTIRDGLKADGRTAMPSFASRMTAQEMWTTVNYIRTLGSK
jgi:mono/diheme cytochrome c family protein